MQAPKQKIERRRPEKPKKKHNFFNGFIIFLCITTIALCFGFSGMSIIQGHKFKVQETKIAKQNNDLQSQVDKLNNRLNQRKLVIANNGGVFSANDQGIVKNIQQVFTTQYTYTSTKDYLNNWKNLHAQISDPDYFKDVYTNGSNDQNDNHNNGNSAGANINATDMKSICMQVQTYKAPNDQFLVIVSYIPYHKSSTLEHISLLTPTTVGYLVKGDQNTLTSIKRINGWGLTMADN